MKFFRLYQLCIIVSITCHLACSQDKNDIVGLEKYKSCCGTEPQVFSIYQNSVYVPNVFTPNGDGINDVFMPTAANISDSLITFGFFIIRDSTGQAMYYRELLEGNAESEAWDGMMRPNPANPNYCCLLPFEDGSFTYAFQFTYKAETGVETVYVEGKACLIRCGAEAAEFAEKTGCNFASQGVGGVYNASVSNGESACFR